MTDHEPALYAVWTDETGATSEVTGDSLTEICRSLSDAGYTGRPVPVYRTDTESTRIGFASAICWRYL